MGRFPTAQRQTELLERAHPLTPGSKRRQSPYEFRKSDAGIWQRRAIGERRWFSLRVEQNADGSNIWTLR